jgi:predicted membrane protein
MKSLARTIIGLLIVAVGASFLLTNLNILPFDVGIAQWWPLFIVAGGVVMLLSDVRNYLWALLVIGLGVLFQLKQFGIVDVNPWQLFWPAIIIVLGVSVMTSRGSSRGKIAASDREDVMAILSGSEVRVESKDFKGSRVTSICGGAMIDLRKAVIKKEATIDVFAFWGGIEIIVPEHVMVKNNTSAIMGGVEQQAGGDAVKEGSPILYVTGDVVMSGVEIKR